MLKSDKKYTFYMWTLLAAALVLRLALWKLRWINPDEGAHLLDAGLLLQRMIPVADFGSRQPFYVLVISGFLKLFGSSLAVGRLMPIAANLGTCWMLYLIAKRLYSQAYGLIAASLFAFLPLTLVWGTTVKTEPLAIFLGCTAMYFVVRSFSEEKPSLLFISALFSVLAFYVRQPALYLPMAIVLFTLLQSQNRWKNTGFYILGYAGFAVLAMALFLPHMSMNDILFSQLNPLNLIWNRLMHLFGALPQQYSITDSEGFRFLDQSISYTLTAWYHAVGFSFFIIIAAIFGLRCRKKKLISPIFMLFTLWTSFVVLLYFYQSASRGFYSQYFTEALPPLILMATPFIKRIYDKIKISALLFTAILFVLFFSLFLVQRYFWYIQPGMAVYFLIACLLGLLLLVTLWNKKLKLTPALLLAIFPGVSGYTSFIIFRHIEMYNLPALAFSTMLVFLTADTIDRNKKWRTIPHLPSVFMVLSGIFITALFSGSQVGPQYEAHWSQDTLKKTVDVLQKEGLSSNEVLSGASIWTFESGMMPFRNTPHPTEFYKHKAEDFEDYLAEHPPAFIIADGYTQRKFERYWDTIQQQLETTYELIATIDGSDYPVRIFKYQAPVETELQENDR